MNDKTVKCNPMLKIAAILLCLVLVSTCFTAGLYAKYTDKGTVGDSARVASFVIDTDLDRISLGTMGTPNLLLGGTDETQSVQLPFYIQSDSEVAVGYSVAVDFGTNLPAYLSLTLSDGTKTQTLTANGSTKTFAFNDFSTMAAAASGTQKAELVLTIAVTDLSLITDEVTIPTAELTVSVYQLD